MIEVWVASFSLILARVGMFVAALPMFGGRDVPTVVKIGLSFGLAVLWFDPTMVQNPVATSGAPSLDWFPFALALAHEAILGLVLGFAFGLFFVPLHVAGEYLGQEMGLALGPMVDPTADNPAAVVTQIFEMLGMLVFFGLDGHHTFLAALHVTFLHWPIGGTGGVPAVTYLVHGAAASQEWGLLLVAPIGIALFATTVVLALLSRAAPQFNNFSVGIALRVLIGLAALILLLPDILAALVNVYGQLTNYVYRLV